MNRSVKNAVSLARPPDTRCFSPGYRRDRGHSRYVYVRVYTCVCARALNIIHYHLGKFVERARKKHVVLTSNSPGASRLRASRSLFRMHSHAWLRVSNGSANGLRRGFQGEGRGDVIR